MNKQSNAKEDRAPLASIREKWPLRAPIMRFVMQNGTSAKVEQPRVRRRARTLFILSPLFLIYSVGASEAGTNKVVLENGNELHIKEILPSRILPHAFYDQAMSSIPGVYPNSQIIAKRRLGYLGKDKSSLYSLVCYKQSKDRDEVTISGVVTNKNRAWSFDARVAEASFVDTLLLLLEVMGEMPLNKALPPTGE